MIRTLLDALRRYRAPAVFTPPPEAIARHNAKRDAAIARMGERWILHPSNRIKHRRDRHNAASPVTPCF